MVSAPDESCDLSPLLPEDEREQVLTEWNSTSTALPNLVPVEMFEAIAKANSAKTALVFNGVTLSYSELDRRANELAADLLNAKVGSGSLVGIYLDRSPEMIISMLALAKIGAAYVPMDPSYPKDRLAFMVGDANLQATLTSSSLAEKAASLGCDTIIAVDGARADIQLSNRPALSQEQVAYVIYTSGSTGTPKGVPISQRALLNFLCAMQKKPGINASDRLLAITTLSFDIAGLELWLPLVSGATVVLASSDDSKDPSAIKRLLEQEDITMMQATPALWTALLQASWEGKKNLVALCGGEALQPQLARELSRKTSALWNMYGPTETTIWSTMAPINPRDTAITIGRPIDNTLIYILDHNLNPAPVGSAGEIYIGGEGLAKGYLNREKLTSEKFIANPFRPNGRLYRTGDLGRYLPDGRIVCLGRTDHQVKLRGFRIEPGEIEAAIEKHPGVTRAVVIAAEDEDGAPILCAYWSGKLGDSNDLRNDISGKLPPYMIPSRWLKLEQIPLTPNGKVDRKRLPAIRENTNPIPTVVAPPETETERAVSALWERVLGTKAIPVTEDFFAAGGHSLAAMRIVSSIRTQLAVEFPLARFFRNPTIRALAAEIDRIALKK
jgi:amino acid adenylation domain-containing protein